MQIEYCGVAVGFRQWRVNCNAHRAATNRNGTGIFISGTFSEDSPAAYAPKMYVDREFFRFPLVQLDGKLEKPVKEKLVGSSLHLPERNRRFRIYTVIGKENGDMEFELQEVEDQEAVDG